jgi:hypothetical protein
MKQLLLFSLLLFSFALVAQEKPIGSMVTNDLIEQMNQKSADELIRINIRLKNQYDLQNLNDALANMDKTARRALVVNELKTFSNQTQKGILSLIEAKTEKNQAQLIYSLWINNVITCLASKEVIYELSLRNDIDRIDWDEERNMLIEQESFSSNEPEDSKGTNEITWNVTKLNVPAVWALGFTGSGVKVGVLDTGVNYNHLDLQDHMWNNPSYPNHGWDFVNNDNNPMDDHGHGTHCAGTVAGDGTAGSQTGMAPDATIIALKVLNSTGNGTESGVWAAIEFIVENDGDIISMSLGWSHSWGPDRPSWRNAYDNALAGGVIAAVAAGNEAGSITNPDDVRTPGDCPPPWLHPDQTLTGGISAVVCVGATDISDNIASFSSRGPVTWSTISPYNDYPFNPGIGLLRPDVSAPGVNIKSLAYSSNNGYADGWNGTSMATPAVAGTMALMLTKNPNLTPAEIAEALEMTSIDFGTAGKDNVFGTGRINALAAVNYVNYPGPVYSSHTITDPNSNGQVEAGENISLSIEMYNGGDVPRTNVVVTISSPSPYISITDNVENYGNFSAWQYKTITNGFTFSVAANTPGMENIRINVSATDGIETWTSTFDIVTYGPRLQFGNITISDPLGNNNGRLDPGETVDMIISAQNTGQVGISNILVTISSLSGLISLNNLQVNIPNIPASGSVNATFNMTVDNGALVGDNIDFHFNMTSGVYNVQKDAVFTVGLIVEDWETGNFGKFPWTFGGTANWTITNIGPYEGTYTAKSGTITHNQTSELLLDVVVVSAGNISFFRKVSSEANYDYLRFYIDGALQGEWAGEVAWDEVSYPVTAGAHTFKWTYYKDGSVNSGSDCAWVDFIIFPPIAPPPSPANISVNPLNFEVTLTANSSTVKQMNLGNTGDLDLNYSITKQYIETNKAPLAYCTSVGGGSDEFIQNVTFGAINNTTGQSYYADYTALSTTVEFGLSYPISIVNGDPIWPTDQCGIWIDWNQNENFTDDGTITVSGSPGVGPYTATIVPPENALPGPTRMRVQIIYAATPNPCQATFSWGEVEDYTVIVNAPSYSWLTVSPTSGTVAGQGSTPVSLTFNSDGLEEGDYFANVKINSNDPYEPMVTIPCTLHVANQIKLELNAMLEGPFTGTEMSTALNINGMLPLNQPFNTAPWSYSGTESVPVIPNANVVDWILVELRDAATAATATPATRIARQAAFMLKDGSIVGLDGTSILQFNNSITQQLFVVIYHRNHLGIMSANPLVQTGDNYTLDFSSGAGQAHGGSSAQKEVVAGVWAMMAGDGDANGTINMNDKLTEWQLQAGNKGFMSEDYNMDGQVNNPDKDDCWVPNLNKGTYIPQ